MKDLTKVYTSEPVKRIIIIWKNFFRSLCSQLCPLLANTDPHLSQRFNFSHSVYTLLQLTSHSIYCFVPIFLHPTL